MKQIFTAFFLFLFTITIAQVPVPNREMARDAEKPNTANEKASYYISEGKFGFMLGTDRQEAIYNNITYGISGFIVQKGKLFGITDSKGNLISKMEYDSIGVLKGDYLIKKENKYGLMSSQGDLLTVPQYKKIWGRNNIVTIVEDSDANVRLIFNETGKKFDGEIDYVNLYYNLAIVKSKGRFGVITDKLIVPFEYDSIAQNIIHLTKVTQKQKALKVEMDQVTRPPAFDLMTLKNGKLGLINSEGGIIYPAENDEIKRESAFGYYSIKKDNLYSIYFSSSKTKTDFDFTRIYTDGYGFIMAIKENRAGAFNIKGELIVPFEYDDDFISQLGPGLRVTKNKKRGIIGRNGQILVPVMYDEVSTLYNSNFRHFIKVSLADKVGVLNAEGNLIIPVEYESVGIEGDYFKVLVSDGKLGLFDRNGKMLAPVIFDGISKSDTEKSKIILLRKDEETYRFFNTDNHSILPEIGSEYGYVLDEELLLNPFSSNGKYLLYVKNKKGKYGLLDEIKGELAVPMIYDAIDQRFDIMDHTYFKVRKGKKFGLIDETNKVVIPLKYQDLKIDFIRENEARTYAIIAAKAKKYGVINLKDEVVIPFQYSEMQRLGVPRLFKAKKDGKYQIVDIENRPINKGRFDEVANFEREESIYEISPSYRALTFREGKMRVIDEKGNYLGNEIEMQPHLGYQTFDELKWALIEALNRENDPLLKDFVDKITPSAALLYYLERNIFNDQYLDEVNLPHINEKYYKELWQFKNRYWNKESGLGFDPSALTNVTDYTLYGDGYITNKRNTDHAFGNVKYLEKFLRNAVKVNGFWISSYFMKPSFNRE